VGKHSGVVVLVEKAGVSAIPVINGKAITSAAQHGGAPGALLLACVARVASCTAETLGVVKPNHESMGWSPRVSTSCFLGIALPEDVDKAYDAAICATVGLRFKKGAYSPVMVYSGEEDGEGHWRGKQDKFDALDETAGDDYYYQEDPEEDSEEDPEDSAHSGSSFHQTVLRVRIKAYGVPQDCDTICITLKTSEGAQEVEVRPTDRVLETVKRSLAVPKGLLEVYFAGDAISEDDGCFADYGIDEGATLSAVLDGSRCGQVLHIIHQHGRGWQNRKAQMVLEVGALAPIPELYFNPAEFRSFTLDDSLISCVESYESQHGPIRPLQELVRAAAAKAAQLHPGSRSKAEQTSLEKALLSGVMPVGGWVLPGLVERLSEELGGGVIAVHEDAVFEGAKAWAKRSVNGAGSH